MLLAKTAATFSENTDLVTIGIRAKKIRLKLPRSVEVIWRRDESPVSAVLDPQRPDRIQSYNRRKCLGIRSTEGDQVDPGGIQTCIKSCVEAGGVGRSALSVLDNVVEQ